MRISGALVLLAHYQVSAALLGVGEDCSGPADSERCGSADEALMCAVGLTDSSDPDATVDP